jgi:hypothetical protein
LCAQHSAGPGPLGAGDRRFGALRQLVDPATTIGSS